MLPAARISKKAPVVSSALVAGAPETGACPLDLGHRRDRPVGEPGEHRHQAASQPRNSYSTVTGELGLTRLSTSPSRSRPRSVWVSIFCEVPPTSRRSSPKRFARGSSATTIRTTHFPATRSRTWRVGQSGSKGSSGGCIFVTSGKLVTQRCLVYEGY